MSKEIVKDFKVTIFVVDGDLGLIGSKEAVKEIENIAMYMLVMVGKKILDCGGTPEEAIQEMREWANIAEEQFWKALRGELGEE